MRKAGRDRDRHAVREAVLLALGCFIALVWAVALLIPLVFPDRQRVDGTVHLVMLAVVTGLFGGAAVAGRKADRNGKDDDDA